VGELSQALMMPPKALDAAEGNLKKRKEPPQSSANGGKQNEKGRAPKRVKAQNARTILTQTSEAALSNGELDLQAFLKAREFEIKALEDGMRRSKSALTTRAFQQVPRDLRRRTASHNVKRVPKRLQKKAGREMREDNTPTVTANKRKPGSSRGRIRAETAKKLGILSQKKKLAEVKTSKPGGLDAKAVSEGIIGRIPRPKVKKGELSTPPRPPSKFRKRQIHKSWLPTHIYHAKRARMTEPKKPLWRLAIPLTPTEKSYRPSHRASNARGVLCWDMSYMATISLEGSEMGLEKVLRAVGIIQDESWGKAGKRWREGKRTWSGWLTRDENGQCKYIGPATIIWCHSVTYNPDEGAKEVTENTVKFKKPPPRRLFIRVHPSAFLELWNELHRLSKMQRPVVHVEDLRFEIGSIEVTGPGSTEALLGTLHAFDQSTGTENDGHVETFNALLGVTNAAALPSNALLTLSVMDPRLRYPPRKVNHPKPSDDQSAFSLLEMLAAWPVDESLSSPSLFDRGCRIRATRLPSQKSINRRKGLAPPGDYPSLSPMDQPIPILLFVSRTTSSSGQGAWTLLAPWKCILPIWYCLMHHPLSSGGNPRFGGLQELQQMHFEHGKPWFPADYPSTAAGWAWEMDEQQKRKEEWDRRPKGKRAEFESLDLGGGRKGEIGLGWACDFERLRKSDNKEKANGATPVQEKDIVEDGSRPKLISPPFQHLPTAVFNSILSNPKLEIPPASLATVRITLFSRGVPLACARIYRLPPHPPPRDSLDSTLPPPTNEASSKSNTQTKPTTPNPSLRDQWLPLAPPANASTPKPTPKPNAQTRSLNTLPPGPLRHRALAQSLLQTPPLPYPPTPKTPLATRPIVPDEEDLIGYVTTGNFNLAEGKGTAIGSIVVEKVLEGLKARRGEGKGGGGGLKREERMCIVRNAGEGVGRLGIWEVV
jgi:ribonuclease P/MRP protein subunit POP1